jgi:hypothetical protein
MFASARMRRRESRALDHKTRLRTRSACGLLLAAVVVVLAVAPAPASAAFTASGTPSDCIFQQHWETTPAGTRYINVDTGNCNVDIAWSHTPEICPPGPQGQDGRSGVGNVHHKRYWKPGFDEVTLPVHFFSDPSGLRGGDSHIGVSPTTADLFAEVDGEKIIGIDQWKIAVQCFYTGATVESATQSVRIIVRGPNYLPPGGGGVGGGGGGTPPPSTGSPPPPPTAAKPTAQRRACVVPKVRGLTVKRAAKKLRKAGCRYRVKGTGRVRSTRPKAGTRTTRLVRVRAEETRSG